MCSIVVSLLLFVSMSLQSAAVSTVVPQAVSWSSKTYGPDGPWQAVTVIIGSDSQNVDLLPGGSWTSDIFSPLLCTGSSVCTAEAAGFYNKNTSTTSFQIGQTGHLRGSSFAGTSGAISSLTGDADWCFDSVRIPMSDGVSGVSYVAEVDDWDMLVVDSAYITLPNGITHTPSIGKLALGAPNGNQTWLREAPAPRWNGTFLPSSMFQAGRIPSNSYGMHIGSAAMGIPGSLYLGGYDQSRVLGDVSSQSYNIDHLPIDLLDIGIGVAEGASPFSFTSHTGLLASGNSSIGPALNILVEATLPYLYLPKSTCNAIAANLPVTFQPDLGLYFWDISDPQYQTIVSSPAFLSFTFRLNASISQNITVNVPFRLLNLTLTAPLAETPTQYFPCSPGLSSTGNFALGRTFLQAAFIGVNWASTSQTIENGRWFLAQAPGPNTPSGNPPNSIEPDDNFIIGSTNEWADTWKGSWTVLTTSSHVPTSYSTSAATNGAATNGAATNGPSPTPNHSLSKGAIAGIAIAGLVVLVAIAVGSFVILRRKPNWHAEKQDVQGVIEVNHHMSVKPELPNNETNWKQYRELETTPRPLVEMAG